MTRWVLVAIFLLFLAALLACAAPRDQVVLLAVTDPGGTLTVQTPHATQTLAQPYATATTRADGRVQPGTTTPAAVQARYGAVLALLPPKGRLWTLRFDTGAVDLTPESQAEVPALLAAITDKAAVEVEIVGHTDDAGDPADNDALSLARAEAVRELLVAQGMRAPFVRVVGRGSRAPLLNFSTQLLGSSLGGDSGDEAPASVPNASTNASGDTDVAASNPELVCGVSLIVGSTFTLEPFSRNPAKSKSQRAVPGVCDRQHLKPECLTRSY